MKALQPPSPKLPSVVPLALLTAPRWLLWKAVPNADKPGAKPRKVPHYIDSTPRRGTLESENDIARLARFDDAWRAYLASPDVWAGIGFAVIGEGIAAFDLDYVLDDQGGFDPDTEAGRIADWALAEGLYMEISPSGTGLRIFGQASILDSIGGRAGGTIEYYAKGKFLTVTGNLYANEQGWGNLDEIRASIARPAEEVTPTANNTAQDECTNPRIVQDLRSALFHLRSDERDLWQRMGHALKTLGDSGRGLWLDWSATSEKFDPADAARAWKSFKPERTSYQAVFAEATRQGWINPSKNYSNSPVPSKARETRDKLLIPVPTLLSQPAAPQWLVRGFLEKNTLGMIFGASGHGKSFIGLALAASVATGTDFFGRAVAPGGVVYVAGEGHHGIARRLKAWEMHAEQKLPDSFTVSSRAVRFLDTADMELLTSEVEAMSVRPTLIVVDTVARAMVGADENSSKEMGIFIAECDALKRRFNCTLLLIHHSGHGEATRARAAAH